jgi:hypothetical protein
MALWAGLPVVGLVALLVVLYRLERQPSADPHGKLWQSHHGYIGAGMALVACLAFVPGVRGFVEIVGGIAYAFGLWWIGDDVYQHHRQYREPFYRSSWHRWAHRQGLIR